MLPHFIRETEEYYKETARFMDSQVTAELGWHSVVNWEQACGLV